MTETQTTETTETDHLPDAGKETQDGAPEPQEAPQEAPETFPKAYVEKLRQEAAEARVRAKRADDYAKELFVSRVAALGKLADPSDLEYSEDLLTDLPALEAAVDELLARKPHLAARTPRGDIGQGVTGPTDTVDLAAILRGGAN